MTNTTRHAVIRIETANYGHIVSVHRTLKAAQKACQSKRERLNRRSADALASLVYTTAEVAGTKGERVRYS